MEYLRAALYLDFDNVFSGLYKLDPDVAVQFADEPLAWLRRLSTTVTSGSPRRWLILRCYLNPNGWVPHRDEAGAPTRLYFYRFREPFVRAGFEVVDCPRRGGTKNAADIRIVVDAVDALTDQTHYDEFVIASGDSDMTPLLHRLRRADRRTVVMSAADAAAAFTAIADNVLDSQQLVALVQGETIELDDEGDTDTEEAELDVPVEVANVGDQPAVAGEAYQVFRHQVEAAYRDASEPVNLASLASRLHTGDSNWFGFGTFTRAVTSLGLVNLRVSQHFMWDTQRHSPPRSATAQSPRLAVPEPVNRLVDQLSLPKLPSQWWPPIYQTLAEYARNNRFNLTQCTGWARDRLHEQGYTVSRNNVGFVVRGAAYGGCPLHRQPSPADSEIRDAFVTNVLNRADAAQIILGGDEATTIRAWLTGVVGDSGDAVPVA